MKKEYEKGKFFFFIGFIFVVGGFYIDNMDAGRAMFELLGIVCFVFAMMSIKKTKRMMSILFFLAFLFSVLVMDYGVVKYFHKAPIFALAKEENGKIHYYGPFYDVWQCDLNNARDVQFSSTCKDTCEQEKSEIKSLEDKLKEQEKTIQRTTIVGMLKERTGILNQEGDKEYIVLSRYQLEPLFGLIDTKDLKNMKVGKKYRITFEGNYQTGEIPDKELFNDFRPIQIEEVSDDTLF